MNLVMYPQDHDSKHSGGSGQDHHGGVVHACNRQSITKIVMASAVGVCLFVSNGHAQSNARFVSSASISIQPASVIVDILKTGEDLERKGLWGDALTLYERAVKDHNKSKQIQQKLFNARTHYDVHRRYADPNFVKTVISTHPSTAQNMLGEHKTFLVITRLVL